MINKFFLAYHSRAHQWLFFSLLLTLGAEPILKLLDIHILKLMLAVNLIAVIFSVPRSRNFIILVFLALAYLIVRVSEIFSSVKVDLPVSEGLWLLGCLVAIYNISKRVLGKSKIDREKIFAALNLFLLSGFIFAFGYVIIDRSVPSSFNISVNEPLSIIESFYFSFVTLATLGYGDIVPVSDTARGLAVLEAVCGQIYLTVLVARLVSLYAKQEE